MSHFQYDHSNVSNPDITKLENLILEVCKKYKVNETQECWERFLGLTRYYRNDFSTTHSEISSDTEWHLKSIRTSAAQLRDSLKSIRNEEKVRFPDFIQKELLMLPLLLGTIESCVNQSLNNQAHSTRIKREITRKFMVICLEFGIPLRRSNDYLNCSKTSSSYVLGAIFEAIGMETDGDETTIKSANYYLGEERTGFICDSAGITVLVSFKGLKLIPETFVPEFFELLRTREMSSLINRIPKSDCNASDIGLKHKLVLDLLKKQTPPQIVNRPLHIPPNSQ